MVSRLLIVGRQSGKSHRDAERIFELFMEEKERLDEHGTEYTTDEKNELDRNYFEEEKKKYLREDFETLKPRWIDETKKVNCRNPYQRPKEKPRRKVFSRPR